MKQLLDTILGFLEEEQRKVDAGILELENTLLGDTRRRPKYPILVLDQYLRTLSAEELKILHVILHQPLDRLIVALESIVLI